MPKQTLLCHIMQDDLKHEIGVAKSKVGNQDFTWRKRMFPISNDAIWVDKKGISHIHVVINESDGTIRYLLPQKQNIIDDKCVACDGKISIDAKNVYDLVKRKTINAIWGIDNSFFLLLIVVGIFAVGALGFAFYLFGQNTTLQNELRILKTPVQMLLGVDILG